MSSYFKIIGLSGSIYTKEFNKEKKKKKQIREITEDTVLRAFNSGETITVYFEEKDEEILLDNFSDPELIRKYLGRNFIDK